MEGEACSTDDLGVQSPTKINKGTQLSYRHPSYCSKRTTSCFKFNEIGKELTFLFV